MIITTLMENTSTKNLKHAHGLSLHIQTPKHRILFDMGPDHQFAENAQTLGIDLAAVDMAFLSHGHDDHAGGLQHFCEHNRKAPIYLHHKAFEPHYVLKEQAFKYIGLSPELEAYKSRLILVSGHTVIDEELQLFTDITDHDYLTDARKALRVKTEQGYEQDLFEHEQDLLITAEGKNVLIAGCAHNGIVNILREAEKLLHKAPDYVIGGFHLYDPFSGKTEKEELIAEIGTEMKRRHTQYFTGHCTGQASFDQLKSMLNEQIVYIDSGSVYSL